MTAGLRAQKGQAIVLVALILVALFGFLGLAVDGGRGYLDRRGMQGAATLQAQCGKLVIAVSEDISPDNADAIFWSLAYRSNFMEDAHIIPYRSSGHGPKEA